MGKLLNSYIKNKSPEEAKEIIRRVAEIGPDMTELSAIQYVLAEMRSERKKNGGLIGKPLGAGGKK